MKTLKSLLLLSVLANLFTISRVNAADEAATDALATNQNDVAYAPCYRPQELSVDLFAAGAIDQDTINNISGERIRHEGRLGAGAGVNYFFMRYVGVGGDVYSEGAYRRFLDSASGNLILRLPIAETGLSPYIFGGAGHQFNRTSQTIEQAGGGLEFRFTRNVGIFVDAQYVFTERTENYGLGRAGFRFSF